MATQKEIDLARAVADAAASVRIIDAVTGLYSEAEQRIRQIGPICELSGRCCRFDDFGHRLYVTTAELATFVAMASRISVPSALTQQVDGSGCRFQQGKLCMVHQLRPMGCRMFYCDPRTQQPLQTLFEQFHQKLKRLHEDLDIPYYYLEWRTALDIIAPLLLMAPTRPGGCPTA